MHTKDIVVIGAGVQGLSIAYNLALGGSRPVLVIEAEDRTGRGSSGRSGSMLMKSRENREKIALSLYSYARFMNFYEEFGEPLHFRKTGFLSAVPPELADRYRTEHQLRLEMGAPSVVLTPKEMNRIAPGLSTDGIEFGVLGPDDGEIRAEQILRAYQRRGKELGVSFRFDERATGIGVRNGAVASVRTTKGTIGCEIAINAAGSNAGEVASWVGLNLPIQNRRRSLFIVETNQWMYQTGPMVEDAGCEFYYRPLEGGEVLVGMGLEMDAGPTDGPNLEFLPQLRQVALQRTPNLRIDTIVGGSSGIRPLTPDILPILGWVEGVAGYLNCCGWGGEGIMHSPAGGSMVTDLVNGTKTCPIDPTPFQLERFLHETSTTSTKG